MLKIKQFIAKNFTSFTYFYRHLRYRLFLLLVLSIAVGMLDGLGLMMFMPFLELVNKAGQVDHESLGNLKFVLDALQNIGLPLTLRTVLSVMVVFFSLKGLAKFVALAYNASIQQYFIRNLREQMLSSLTLLRYTYFVTSDVGHIQNTMSGEAERVSIAFQNYSQTIREAVQVLVYMGFAFLVDIRFALLVTVAGWLTNFLYRVIYNKTIGVSRKFTVDSHLYQSQIIQFVTYFKYLKATALFTEYAARLRNSIKLIEQSRQRIGMLVAVGQAAREPLMILVVVSVIFIQTELLHAPLSFILVSLLFFYRALTALTSMQNGWNQFLTVSGSLDNVINFQDELRRNREISGKEVHQVFKDSLVLKNVNFSYDNEPILQDITLRIEKNETVAFVGESGSGKTTLVNILAGLLLVDNGIMLIDGQNRKDIDIISFQKRLGYITQEPVIFNDTIFNNITFWAEPNEKNKKRFEKILQKSAMVDFVHKMSNGPETLLGHSGVNLSGGQRQRISIARELYKETDILIMDEATSALDSETEKVIQASIDHLKGQCTILIVAHRLSTIRNSDRIVLIRDGRIIAVNNYEELLRKNKTFRRMVDLQEL